MTTKTRRGMRRRKRMEFRLVLAAECELIRPASRIDGTDLRQIEVISRENQAAGEANRYGYRQYLVDPER